jgi:hypothetical protein
MASAPLRPGPARNSQAGSSVSTATPGQAHRRSTTWSWPSSSLPDPVPAVNLTAELAVNGPLELLCRSSEPLAAVIAENGTIAMPAPSSEPRAATRRGIPRPEAQSHQDELRASLPALGHRSQRRGRSAVLRAGAHRRRGSRAPHGPPRPGSNPAQSGAHRCDLALDPVDQVRAIASIDEQNRTSRCEQAAHAPDLHVAAMRLAVDHGHAAGSDREVVDVRVAVPGDPAVME